MNNYITNYNTMQTSAISRSKMIDKLLQICKWLNVVSLTCITEYNK